MDESNNQPTNQHVRIFHTAEYANLVPIGKGGFSTVFSATHISTGIPIAMKRVEKRILHDKIVFRNFQREIRILKSLDHPFIAHFIRMMEDNNYFYLIMEDCSKGTLLQFLNNYSPLSEKDAHAIFSQLLSVLHYLHYEKKIVHRDLKMENILFADNGTMRIIDFGLSGELFPKYKNSDTPPSDQCHVDEGHYTGHSILLETQCGSFPYAAPEIFRKKPYNGSVDVWSAGVILFAMTTGHLPFNDQNSKRLIHLILNRDPIYPSSLSPELVDLLSRLLNKDRKTRLTIQEALEHPWVTRGPYSLLADEHFLSDPQFHVILESTTKLDKELLDILVSENIDVENIENEISEIIKKQADASIVYFTVLNDNFVVTYNSNGRMQYSDECEFRLNSNISESQAVQVYRMLKIQKIKALLTPERIINSHEKEAETEVSNPTQHLPSLSQSLNNDNSNSSLPDAEKRQKSRRLSILQPETPKGGVQRPLAINKHSAGQLELLLMRSKQPYSNRARPTKPLITSLQ